ncbi:MAG: arginyltransferase [Leptospirales bacterium]|nr:arginyltransferase [Leptospirales bacterium]
MFDAPPAKARLPWRERRLISGLTMRNVDVLELCADVLEDQLYLGHVRGPCSYLPDRQQALMLLDGREVGKLYRLLLDRGYRRHGQHIYRPDCGGCRECRILRLPLASFQPTRSQRRVWRRASASLRYELAEPIVDAQRIELYSRYLAFQHAATNENSLSDTQYQEFFVDSFLGEGTRELRLWRDRQLAGVGIVDLVGDALSSVYFYFDPDCAELSPGVFSMLCELELARKRGLRYYYPGYYVHGCATMNYKARFGPNEMREIGARDWRSGQRALRDGGGVGPKL